MSALYTRVYETKYSRVCHLLHASHGPSDIAEVECGDLRREWLGTGSQNEIERAAALPLCADCEKAWALSIVRRLFAAINAGDWRTTNRILGEVEEPYTRTVQISRKAKAS